ncbi:uncharacterized protein V6R79_014600 [Siganus canaliculatus]
MSAAKRLLSLLVLLEAAAALVQAQDRVKMCGRDLIRLAVTSCGNSRLRRSIQDVDPEELQHRPHWDQAAASTLELQGAAEGVHAEEEVSSLAPHWLPVVSRFRRTSGKMSDVCCEKGCSLKELIQFC